VRAEAGQPVDDEVLLALLGSLISGRPGSVAAGHLAAAKTYIEDHLTDSRLTAARIADGVGLSERHLSRVFAASGTTVPQYVLGRRLERAHALLRSGDGPSSVGEVAAACGFGSAARFSHMFRERYEVRATDVLRAASASTMSKRTRDQD
jgi:transcriptional regulator GlxA family with amidase domain